MGRPQIGKPFVGSLQERIANAKAAKESNTSTIQLLVDCSGSMDALVPGLVSGVQASETRISLLRKAVDSFINETDLAQYQIGIEPFPPTSNGHCKPTNSRALLGVVAAGIESAYGATPMGAAISRTLNLTPLPERAIIISDGEATDNAIAPFKSPTDFSQVAEYEQDKSGASTEIQKRTMPVFDCVHIGDSSSGEETLKEISKLTGGIYMKFKDLDAFKKSFKYLSPKYRAMLTSGNAKELTGAEEVK